MSQGQSYLRIILVPATGRAGEELAVLTYVYNLNFGHNQKANINDACRLPSLRVRVMRIDLQILV